MIVTRAPSSNMTASSLHEIDVVYEIFQKAASTNGIASNLWACSSHRFPVVLNVDTTTRNISRGCGAEATTIPTIPVRSVPSPEQSSIGWEVVRPVSSPRPVMRLRLLAAPPQQLLLGLLRHTQIKPTSRIPHPFPVHSTSRRRASIPGSCKTCRALTGSKRRPLPQADSTTPLPNSRKRWWTRSSASSSRQRLARRKKP